MEVFETINFDTIILNLRKKNYKCIGCGSGRCVYDLEDGYVVKVAKNKKGIAQNEVEYLIFTTDPINLFANITQVSENFMYLIMEKAEPIYNFPFIWKYYNVTCNRELFSLEELRYIFEKYNLLSIDLCKLANWGLINNRPVIIDYGFTRNVKRRYYTLF